MFLKHGWPSFCTVPERLMGAVKNGHAAQRTSVHSRSAKNKKRKKDLLSGRFYIICSSQGATNEMYQTPRTFKRWDVYYSDSLLLRQIFWYNFIVTECNDVQSNSCLHCVVELSSVPNQREERLQHKHHNSIFRSANITHCSLQVLIKCILVSHSHWCTKIILPIHRW